MTLEESIAKFNLGVIELSQFPKIAVEALVAGVESESLIILAGMNESHNSFEIEAYLGFVIDELELVSHQSLNAAFVLANAYINSFKKDEINVIQCIYNIKNRCLDNCQNEMKDEKYLFDSIRFEKIIGAWYEYHEIDEWTKWVKNSSKSANQIKKEIEKGLEKMILEWQSIYLIDKIENLKK